MRTKLIYIMLIIPLIAWGQEERKYIRDGYKAYLDENYSEAEVSFRKAEEEKSDSYIARYNTSTALYQQNKLEESGKRFTELLQETSDPAEQARLLHNIGNVMVEGQQYKEAVEAYKRSLKLNPQDDDTRYNLAYALEKLEEQQQQEQNQDQQNNQEQNEEQQQQDQEQEQKDQQQQQDQEQKDQQQQQEQEQQQPQQLTQEEAERLLNAILQKEKDVKEEVDKKKATAAKIKTDKDW
ncbi:MAG: tetratricopeptide repeat protein [Bacteroidales bacterium]|nr:tetratricopeptide repeat protein [Bacteroidales bacterium]MDT8430920.1 tetratricopeptide repeat protein [Bacteroidales bacterium]